MVDLTQEMAALWVALGAAPAHRGRVVQFVSATGEEGTSTVAREFARLAAVRARKPVWLIDADLWRQTQLDAVASEPDRFGRLGQAAAASPDGSSYYALQPALVGKDGRPIAPSRLSTARPCLGGRLWVTKFRTDLLRSGQRAEAQPDARYWDALRRHTDTVIVDAPSADRSDLAMTLAPFMDSTILVVAAETTNAAEPAALRDEIGAAGGRIAGLVMNRAVYRPPAFLRRVAR